jgi:type IV pilus assembly protein PilO
MGISNIKLRANLEVTKVKYEAALKQLPVFEKDPEIAYNVKSMADQSQVKLNSIVFSDSTLNTQKTASQSGTANPASNGENIYRVPVSINASGSSYANIMDLVDLIETDPGIAEINTLNIVKQQDISLTMNFTYLFTLDNAKEALAYDFNKGTYGKPNPFN